MTGNERRRRRGSARAVAPLLLASVLAGSAAARGEETERLYLSGRGPSDAVPWDFQVSAGRRAGVWSTLPVPSQWELHSFGTFRYGMDDAGPDEEGRYRRRFVAPSDWARKRTVLVFDGCMTDCLVSLNGEPVGPAHRGGFTRFRYDVTGALRFGEENLLEVDVRERSANRSIERAEREADYWLFGGIYRPVWLEASPLPAIDRVRIAAAHDGRLRVEVNLVTAEEEGGSASGGDARSSDDRRRILLRGEVRELRSGRLIDRFSTSASGSEAVIGRSVSGVRPWSAEDPFLYELALSIEASRSSGGREATSGHARRETFGFRSSVVKPGRGFFVNGRRVLLKGINRHSFWPTTGRALDPATNRADVELIRALNANAVRASHYPPDEDFLRACDELGLYVVDELPGWHDAYDDAAGRRIAREMIERDHNHPSIVAWANGNEGGWNAEVDREIGRLDLQRRPVFHPGGIFGGVDFRHYPTWDELRTRLDASAGRNRLRALVTPPPVVLPTEALHGLYDGGLGAGLEDAWELVRASPLAAGLFLWSFADEGVVRGDRGGVIDTFANYGPDGLVGPFREKEASFWAVRATWAPVVVVDSAVVGQRAEGVRLTLENRYDLIDLEGARLFWEWLRFPQPGGRVEQIVGRGAVATPAIAPGARGEVMLEGPPAADSRVGAADALRLRVVDAAGREVLGTVLPSAGGVNGVREEAMRRAAPPIEPDPPLDRGQLLLLRTGEVAAEIDAQRGVLVALRSGTRRVALAGPRAVSGADRRRPDPGDEDGQPVSAAVSVRREREGASGGQTVVFSYEGALAETRFTLEDDGWLRVAYTLRVDERTALAGVLFDLDGPAVRGMRWLGDGPHRVWGNRRQGGRLGLWVKENVAETSAAQLRGATGTRGVQVGGNRAPDAGLAGFYARVRWATLDTASGAVTLALDDPSLFLSVLEPRFPVGTAPDGKDLARHARVPVPAGDVGILHVVPGIGNKFHTAEESGPLGRILLEPGRYSGGLRLRIEDD